MKRIIAVLLILVILFSLFGACSIKNAEVSKKEETEETQSQSEKDKDKEKAKNKSKDKDKEKEKSKDKDNDDEEEEEQSPASATGGGLGSLFGKKEEPAAAENTESAEPVSPAQTEAAPPAPVYEWTGEMYTSVVSSLASLHYKAGQKYGDDIKALPYDLDNDGTQELLVIKNQMDNTAEVTSGIVYSISGGEAPRSIYTSQDMSLAGGGNGGFYEVNYKGEKLFAFGYGNYDGGVSYRDLYVLTSSGSALYTDLTLRYEIRDNDSSGKNHWLVNGTEVSDSEASQISYSEIITSWYGGTEGSELLASYGESRQTLKVVCSGSEATITLYEYDSSQQQNALCEIRAYIGKNGISYSKQEGDRCTPAGTFNILYYVSDRALDSGLRYLTVPDDGDTWVCVSSSRNYNTLCKAGNLTQQELSDSEDMVKKFANGKSVACIVFDFNGDGVTSGSAVANGGSDLFLDGVGSNGNLTSGYGDIKITGSDMYKLLSLLDSSKNPVIVIS